MVTTLGRNFPLSIRQQHKLMAGNLIRESQTLEPMRNRRDIGVKLAVYCAPNIQIVTVKCTRGYYAKLRCLDIRIIRELTPGLFIGEPFFRRNPAQKVLALSKGFRCIGILILAIGAQDRKSVV